MTSITVDAASLAAFRFREQEIIDSNPISQPAVVHAVDVWKARLEGHVAGDVLDHALKFTGGHLSISRKTIFDAVRGRLDPKCRFLLQMLWGNAPGDGRAPSRVRKYFDSPELVDEGKYEKIVAGLANGRIRSAFDSLMNVDGLNTSFLSKVLYFETRLQVPEIYALILDDRAAAGLVNLVSPWAGSCLAVSAPRASFDDNTGQRAKKNRLEKSWKRYWSYVEGCHAIADSLGTQADHVEYFLFQQG